MKSWILKKFDNDAQNGPLDLVNPAAAAQYGYPLSLWTYDEELRGKLSSALYVASREGKQTSPTTITFEYADQDLAVRKTFSFDNTYIVNVESSVTYKGSAVAALPAWPSGFGDQVTPAFWAAGAIDYQFNKNIERVPIKKVSGGGDDPGAVPLGRADRPVFRGGVHSGRSGYGVDGDAAELVVGGARSAEAGLERNERTWTWWAPPWATCTGRRRSESLLVPRNWRFCRRFQCRASRAPTTI